MNEQGDLVKLLDLDTEFIIDLKYSTPDNFTGKQVYNSNTCYLNKNTAAMLIKAKDIFKRDGYRVVVWDAYRPISAQKRFWELIPNDDFIARPPDMEKIKSFRPTHLNGMCVDITLADNSGKEVVMPSAFDDFTDKAKLGSADADSQAFINANYMKEVMESVGFQAYENEWWHFYDITTPPVPFMDFQI